MTRIYCGKLRLLAICIFAVINSSPAPAQQASPDCAVSLASIARDRPWTVTCGSLDNVLAIQVPAEYEVSGISVMYIDESGTEQPVPEASLTKIQGRPGAGGRSGRIQVSDLKRYVRVRTDGTGQTHHLVIRDDGKEAKIAIRTGTISGRTITPTDDPASYETWTADKYPVLRKYGAGFKKLRYNRQLNQFTDGNTIHVFLDENGDFIRSSIPTTATDKNFFVFHVVYRANDADGGNAAHIRCTYEGDYDPRFEVYGTTEKPDTDAEANASGEDVPKFREKIFGPFGPFTDYVSIKITVSGTPILDKRVRIAKVHHIALNAGLIGSFLRNPDNIRIGQLPDGDTTLLADDPTTRGFVTVMLTFYPHPRNLLFPLSRDWRERIGFTVGTSISRKLAENFFGGISYDVARGLAIAGGVHYGRRQVVIDHEDFQFGTDRFTGSTIENKVVNRWDASFFLGLTIDSRLLSYIFNTGVAAGN